VPVFRQIAEALTAAGAAVLRVDGRGVGGSGGSMTNATLLTLVEDARAAIRYLRSRPELDPARVALVGCGEGGTIAALTAGMDSGIAAVALLAAPGKPGSEILLEQHQHLLDSDPSLSAEEKKRLRESMLKAIDAVRMGRDVEDLPDVVRAQVAPAWVKAFLTYDPVAAFMQVSVPVLVLHGDKDRQIVSDNARLVQKALRDGGNRRVQAQVFPALNHIFVASQTGPVTEPRSFSKTLDPSFLSVLSGWFRETIIKSPALQRR
jgi:uncharacterized protein